MWWGYPWAGYYGYLPMWRWAYPYGIAPYGYPPVWSTYAPAAYSEQEIGFLKSQARFLETQLEGIKRRISELESRKPRE
ncbi:MAG: hypothetical protein B1H40_01520 [Candidatus Latescibacteria bacterium 4484_181]|nr:MAG: hypothetical protein B1H40_01520 [Candidatus Latescibacteria bacterium 4484_181]RKY68184.1 MAG: hypothetical protein DRQ02_05045 [Candidatus Latescibacterota bacterium]RKY71765.1 MAG: hypothetical protein DRQ24_06645 [Candidatus Latescibacterota bacterium]